MCLFMDSNTQIVCVPEYLEHLSLYWKLEPLKQYSMFYIHSAAPLCILHIAIPTNTNKARLIKQVIALI